MMQRPVETSKRADALSNRARLLAVAQTVFAEEGLDLEVNEIIARSRLGVGTFYRHFGKREDLLRAVVTQTVEDAQRQIRQAIEPYADDPRAALQALVAMLLRVYQQHQPLFATMRDRRLSGLFDPVQREALYERILDPPRWVVERGRQAGVFRQDVPQDLAATTIIGVFTSAIEFLGYQRSLDDLAQPLFQMLWSMLAT
jgi:TetR/AcrR family transcriptional regulator, mexCD-oprJ operon repressor